MTVLKDFPEWDEKDNVPDKYKEDREFEGILLKGSE